MEGIEATAAWRGIEATAAWGVLRLLQHGGY